MFVPDDQLEYIPNEFPLAKKRREIMQKEKIPTFLLGKIKGYPAILCLCCGMSSPNINDITNRYCGFCNEFHE